MKVREFDFTLLATVSALVEVITEGTSLSRFFSSALVGTRLFSFFSSIFLIIFIATFFAAFRPAIVVLGSLLASLIIFLATAIAAFSEVALLTIF